MTIFVGHFGSGKTEIALNGALELAAGGRAVTLADLDVVKPYFRSRSARDILSRAGIELLAPTGANVHADLPIIVPQIRSQLRDSNRRLIMDVGGDEVGARVLGSLSDVVPFDDTDCFLVLNFRRPSTPESQTPRPRITAERRLWPAGDRGHRGSDHPVRAKLRPSAATQRCADLTGTSRPCSAPGRCIGLRTRRSCGEVRTPAHKRPGRAGPAVALPFRR